jgi:hypothetical protein
MEGSVMPDTALWTTMISAAGAGASALGAVVMTNRGTLRRDRQQQEQKEVERRSAEQSARETERREVWLRLLKAAGRVRAGILMLGEGYQADLEARLLSLREDAVTVAEQAALVVVLYAGDPHGAEMASAAQEMAAATADLIARLNQVINRSAGMQAEIVGDVSFAEFDSCLAGLQRTLSTAMTNPEAAHVNGVTIPLQRARIWSRRREASSR